MSASAALTTATVYDGTMDDVLLLSGASQSSYTLTALPYDMSEPAIVSVWARADAPQRLRIEALGGSYTASVGQEWTRVVIQVDAPSARTVSINPLYDTAVMLYKAMVEAKANHVSDWVAAPEDTEADIDDIRTELEVTKAGVEARVTKSDLETYLRYSVVGGVGTVEIGQSGSDYKTQTDNEGFRVIQSGAVMTEIKKNTVSAPVVEAKRMIQMGDHLIKLSSTGHLNFC